ncbi:hypothetical protein [Hyphomonas sp.]
MSVWFPFGFKQSRSAHDAAARLRKAFPWLGITVQATHVEISGLSPEDEDAVLRAAADMMIACRNAFARAA